MGSSAASGLDLIGQADLFSQLAEIAARAKGLIVGTCTAPSGFPTGSGFPAKGLSPRVRGLKARLITPELVERFVATYATEVYAADREQNARRARLTGEQARITRQIRTILDTIKEIGGSRSLVEDLRKLESGRTGCRAGTRSKSRDHS